MTRLWILLPYDASPVAKASLVRVARVARRSRNLYAGVMVAVAGIDPSALTAALNDAQVVAGAGVPLEMCLLHPGDPVQALHELAETVPDMVVAAPLGGWGKTPWYGEACALGTFSNSTMLIFMSSAEIARFEETAHERHRMGERVRGVLRGGAGLRLGKRPAVAAR